MRQKHLNIILIIGIIISVCVSLWPNEETPQIPTIDYSKYEQRFKKVEQRIDSVYNQINIKDSTIHENTNFVNGATRNQRDSLRSILNPR